MCAASGVGTHLHSIGRDKTYDFVMIHVEETRLLTGSGYHCDAILRGKASEEAECYRLPGRDSTPEKLEYQVVPLLSGMVGSDRPTAFAEFCSEAVRISR